MKNLQQNYKNYKYAYQFEDTGRYNIFLYILEKINERIVIFKCRKGHTWEHISDMGPDSGSESVTCTCCGASHINTYY